MRFKGKTFHRSKHTTKTFLRYKYLVLSSFRNRKQTISHSELKSLAACS